MTASVGHLPAQAHQEHVQGMRGIADMRALPPQEPVQGVPGVEHLTPQTREETKEKKGEEEGQSCHRIRGLLGAKRLGAWNRPGDSGSTVRGFITKKHLSWGIAVTLPTSRPWPGRRVEVPILVTRKGVAARENPLPFAKALRTKID